MNTNIRGYLVALLLAPAALASAQQEPLLPNTRLTHIGIVVKDMDEALDHWMTLLSLEEPPEVIIAAGHEANPTQYRGEPSEGKAKLAFMNLENIRVELIEPFGAGDSHWKEFLQEKGEGVHHIAFTVTGLGEVYVETFEKAGFPLAQHGGWETGEYGYMDGLESLGVMVELIENYDR